jgi:hypothetical protein
VQYRVLGDASEYENVRTAEPSLEDGYIWLMQGWEREKKQAAKNEKVPDKVFLSGTFDFGTVPAIS